MTRTHFNSQIERLRSQWHGAYGPERLALLWHAWERVDDGVFTDVVDRALITQRAAPLAEDLARIEGELREERARARLGSTPGEAIGGIWGQMQRAARHTKGCDKEFVQACLKLLRDKLSGRLSHKQFLEGCDYLDQVAAQLNR